jgi:hypothetical protein
MLKSMTSPNTAEPAPTASTGPAIWPLVIADLRREFPSEVTGLLIKDARERDEIGTAKYGVPLQANNGRRPLIDAYQEALDLAVYLRQAIEEGEMLGSEYNIALVLLVRMRRRIEAA